MSATLDLPQRLLLEAMKLSNKQTKTATIITALEDLVRKNKIQAIKKFKGKVDLQIDLDTLRKRA